MSYTSAQIKSSIQRVTAFIRTNKRNPKTIKTGNNTLLFAQYLQLPQLVNAKKAIEEFRKQKGRLPNYVTICGFKCPKEVYSKLFSLTSTSNTSKTTVSSSQTRFVSSPYLLSSSWVKQDYDTSCALNSIQQSIYKLTGLKISESTMYKLGYTGANGTGHDGINNIIKWFNKQYHYDLKVSWKNLSDFGSTSKSRWNKIGELMSRKDTAIFAHILYHNGGTTTGSSHNYGHYEVFDIVNTGTMYIRALNSLSGGYLQDRKISVEEAYMRGISQPSICIIKK